VSKHSLPSKAQMVKNLTGSAAKIVKGAVKGFGFMTDATERQRRLGICSKCKHFMTESKRCDVCGCFIAVKASFAATECDLGKW